MTAFPMDESKTDQNRSSSEMRNLVIIRRVLILLLVFLFLVSSTLTVFALSDYSIVFTGAYDGTTRWISPLQSSSGDPLWSTVTSKWSEPRRGGTSPHLGVDLYAPYGTRVVAVQNGYATALGGAYNTLSLGGKNGIPYCHYQHMSKILETGYCLQGDIIGLVGDYGSPGSVHLHFGAYTKNSLSGRLSYRNETFYRNAKAWNYGRDLDVYSNVQFNGGRVAKLTVVFSGDKNTNNELAAEVRIYHRKKGKIAWIDGGVMTKNGFDYSYRFSPETYPVGSEVQWMVRIKRNINTSYPYTWAPSKFYNPNPNPNANSMKYGYFSNKITY